jgi:hypothetical protein
MSATSSGPWDVEVLEVASDTQGAHPKIILLLLAVGAALIAAETGLRVRSHFENLGLFTPRLDVPIPANRHVTLGHVIRPAKNPRIVYELKPNLSVLYAGKPMTTNSLGFRSRETQPQKKRGCVRIVGIGDSAMFGAGVADGENHLDILANLLEGQAGMTEVINTAVPGYNTVMEVETLKDKGLQLEPDVVIIQFVANDLTVPHFVRRPEDVLSIRRSFLADLIRSSIHPPRDHWEALARSGLERAQTADEDGSWSLTIDPDCVPPQYRCLVGWRAFQAAMEELRDLSQLQGFRVIWLSLGAYPMDRISNAREIARSLGFDIIDMCPVFQEHLRREGCDGYLGSSLSVSKRDPHPSPTAHAITAEVVAKHLRIAISE